MTFIPVKCLLTDNLTDCLVLFNILPDANVLFIRQNPAVVYVQVTEGAVSVHNATYVHRQHMPIQQTHRHARTQAHIHISHTSLFCDWLVRMAEGPKAQMHINFTTDTASVNLIHHMDTHPASCTQRASLLHTSGLQPLAVFLQQLSAVSLSEVFSVFMLTTVPGEWGRW